MRVKLNSIWSSPAGAGQPGEIVTVAEEVGRDLVNAGAIEVGPADASVSETATDAPTETTAGAPQSTPKKKPSARKAATKKASGKSTPAEKPEAKKVEGGKSTDPAPTDTPATDPDKKE